MILKAGRILGRTLGNSITCWPRAFLPFPEKETSKINSLIKGIDDEKQKIRVLYHYLQDETRYINISLETGGLKPRRASYVAK